VFGVHCKIVYIVRGKQAAWANGYHRAHKVPPGEAFLRRVFGEYATFPRFLISLFAWHKKVHVVATAKITGSHVHNIGLVRFVVQNYFVLFFGFRNFNRGVFFGNA